MPWEKITIDRLGNLVNSMPKRVFEVIRLNSAKTTYQLLCLFHFFVSLLMQSYIFAPLKIMKIQR